MLDKPINGPDILMTPTEIALAAERGRLMAANAVRANPESKRRVERKYGKKYCMKRWPEAYTGG